MATELTDLELGEWSICIDPANEDSTIEIVKSKSGLAPVLKETDMSDQNDDAIDQGEHEDAELQEFADGVLEEFSELPEDEQADALVGLALENAAYAAKLEEGAEVIKALTENTVPREKYDEVVKLAKSAGDLIEKMKSTGNAATDDGGLVAEIRKANGGADLSPEAIERLERIEKAQAEADRKDAIAKAKTYGFGKAEEVADLETRIRKSLGAKDADAFVAIVKQAGQLAKKHPLFKPLGEDAGNPDANSPIAKAKAGADEIRKANPNLTPQQAMSQFWEQNPELYAAHREGRAAA